MIFRFLALLILPLIAYYLVKSASQRFSLSRRQTHFLFFIVVALLIVSILIVLGRLPVHFIIAPLGAAAAFLLRMLPTLLRLLPMWQMFKGRMASAGPRKARSRQAGQSSTIRTEYLAMELHHDSGDMDGIVLKGAHAQKRLSSMELKDLKGLYQECQQDSDSIQVLQAYIERAHPDWQEQAGANSDQAAVSDESVMTRELAMEILGLDSPTDKEQVIKAHRHLMQKLHPDRGGTDYLAKKINAAKDYLLKDL